MTNIVRRVEVQGRAVGLDKVKSQLDQVASAQDKVATSGDRMAKVQGSAETRVARLQRSLDPAYRATQQMANAQRTLDAALAQGSITQARHAQLVELASAKYQANTMAANNNAVAIKAHNKAMNLAMNNSRQLSFQLIDIGQALATAPTMGIYALQNLGFQVAQIGQLYMGRGGFNQAIKDSAVQIGGFITRMGPLAAVVGAAGIAFAGLRHEINATSDTQVSFGNVFQATLIVARRSIYSLLQPAIAAISPLFTRVWNAAVTATKTAINGIVGFGVGAVKAIVAAWEAFPDALGDVAYSAANKFILGIKSMAREAILLVGDVVGAMNGALGTNIARPRASLIKQGGINNPYAGAASDMGRNVQEAFLSGFETDYAGKAFEAIRTEAIALAKATGEDVKAGAGKAGKALKAAADTGKDAWQGLRKATDDTLQSIRSATNELGQSVGGIFKGLLDKTLSWKDAAIQALNSVLVYLNKMNVARGGSGIFGGGFFQSLLGGFLGIGFASGGYTGNIARNRPAGVVHGQEYVVNANATARYRPQLEAMNAGRAPANMNQTMQPMINIAMSFDGRTMEAIARDESGKVVAAASKTIVDQAMAATADRRARFGNYMR